MDGKIRVLFKTGDIYLMEAEGTVFKNQLFYWAKDVEGPYSGPFVTVFEALQHHRQFDYQKKNRSNLILVDFRRKKKL